MHSRSFGFQFCDSLLSGTASNSGIHLFYSGKEYADIKSFIEEIKPTEEESKFLTEKTQELINKP